MTTLSGLAHLVVLAVLMQFDAPTIGDSRLLDAVQSRFVAVEAFEMPEPVEAAEIVVLEPEPEPATVGPEAVPTEREVEQSAEVARHEPDADVEREVEQPAEVARHGSDADVELDTPVVEQTVATNVILEAEPVVISDDAAAPVAVDATPVVQAAVSHASENAQDPEPDAAPVGLPQVDDERLARVRARYERQVHSRLSQLGDAPSRLLRATDHSGPFEVELVAIVDEHGRILELRLVRSSGLPDLDEFAQTSVTRLRRLVRVPAELGDDARQVPISLVYEA